MKEEIIQSIKEKAIQIVSEEELDRKLKSGKKLKIKLGADPSRPDLHIGHSVVLNVVRQFQELGHEVIFVIGDFTAMIGDPSGKSKTRPALTFEETRRSGETYLKQVAKILDMSKTTVEYNSGWLGKMDFNDILALASKYTLARILERDDFKNRYENNLPVGMHELLYPLMQGYDSVALKADIEIGGTDQTFNLLVGRQLQKEYGQEPQVVLTFPLLAGLDGKEKMSKSLDNYIGIDESPEVIYEKAMKIPDILLPEYFKLTTEKSEEEIDEILKEEIQKAHEIYAKGLVERYHGIEQVADAVNRYKRIAKRQLPEAIKVRGVEESQIDLCRLLMKVGFASSKSEARRLITGRGIKINGDIVEDRNKVVEVQGEIILQLGKTKFIKIVREEA